MAKKLNTNANNIIDKIITRFKNIIGLDVFEKLFLYEKNLRLKHPRHLLSVEDCKIILMEYIEKFPFYQRESILETESECLLLLYNWQKSKIIYHVNISQNNNIPDEYVDSKIFNQFPYSGIYIDYNLRNTEYYGVFVTCYKNAEKLHLQKRLLFGFVMRDEEHDVWSIEPTFFDVKNNISVTETIKATMSKQFGCDKSQLGYLNDVSNLSCITVKFISSIIEYYNLEPMIKRPHTYKTFSKHNNEYDVNVDISSTIKLNKNKIIYQKRKGGSFNKSTPKSPHPRRAHERKIAVKNKTGEIVGHKTIWVSSSYIHGDEVNKPINIKNVEE